MADLDPEYDYCGVFTGCHLAYPWIRGDSSLTIVHPETFSEVRINNFFVENENTVFSPLSVIVSPVSRNIMGTVEYGGRSYDFVFSDRQSITRINQERVLGPRKLP